MLHTPIEIPPGTRLAQFARMIEAFERDDIETAVDLLIERLDAQDGDADVEANGDELDGTGAEDDFMQHFEPFGLDAPGCPVADPAENNLPEGMQGGEAFRDGDYEEDRGAFAIRRPYRDRIRAERCDVTATYNRYNGRTYRDYRLRDQAPLPDGWRRF